MPEQQTDFTINWTMMPIEVHEPGATPILPENIVPVDSTFDLVAKFQGQGPGWDVLLSGETAEVMFFLEGLGTKLEKDLGPVVLTILTPGPSPWPYTATYTYDPAPAADGPLPEGLYKYSCVVTFKDATSGSVIPGVAGYADADNLLQVYPI